MEAFSERAMLRLLSVLALSGALGCSSRSSKEYAVGGTAGTGAGGSSAGGVSGSGQSGGEAGEGSGGSEGGATAGGAAGSASGSSGDGGSGGSAGSTSVGFPNTPILDDFKRQDGEPGSSWTGSTLYSIAAEELSCIDCATATLWTTSFGANQEVYATLAGFGTDAEEINLLLKMQEGLDCDVIEIIYDPAAGQLRVEYCFGGQWNSLGNTAAALEPSDQLGGRAHEDGTVEIFVNGDSVVNVDLKSYPYAMGRIGVSGIAVSAPNRWDDFGGGNWQP